MTTFTRGALVLAVLAATAGAAPAASAASIGSSPPASPVDTFAAGPQALTWVPCAVPGGPAGQECAQLPVPRDYADPSGPQETVAVSRIRSKRPGARRGALLLIPEGPGGSGVR